MMWGDEDPVLRPVVDLKQESPEEDLNNALQVLVLTNSFTLSPMDVQDNLLAVEARIMRALMKLEGKPA